MAKIDVKKFLKYNSSRLDEQLMIALENSINALYDGATPPSEEAIQKAVDEYISTQGVHVEEIEDADISNLFQNTNA